MKKDESDLVRSWYEHGIALLGGVYFLKRKGKSIVMKSSAILGVTQADRVIEEYNYHYKK